MKREGFLKGAGLLYLLNLITNASGLIVSVILARGLEINDYGIFIILSSIVSLALPIVDLGTQDYTLSIIPKNSQDSQNKQATVTIVSVYLLNVIIGILSLILIYLLSDFLTLSILNTESFGILLIFLSSTILLIRVAEISKSILLSFGYYGIVFIVGMAIAVSQPIIIAIFLSISDNLRGAVTGSVTVAIMGMLLWLLVCLNILRRRGHLKVNEISFKKIIDTIKAVIKFGYPISINNLFSTLREQGKNLLIGYFLNPTATAIFNRATRIADLPIQTFQALQGVSVPHLANAIRMGEESVTNLYRKLLRFYVFYGLIISIILLIFGNDIILFLYTEKFSEAVPLLIILALGSILRSVGMSMVSLIIAFEKTEILAKAGVVFNVIYILIIAGILYFGNLYTLATGILALYCIWIPIFVWFSRKSIKVNFHHSVLLKPIVLLILIVSLYFGLLTIIIDKLIVSIIVSIIFILLFANYLIEREDIQFFKRLLESKMDNYPNISKYIMKGIETIRFTND